MTDKQYIIGCDEVGYGALAGPLTVAAVRAPKDWSIPGLNDSKKLSDKQRREMSEKIWHCMKNNEITFSIIDSSNKAIDEHGVYSILKQSFAKAIKSLDISDSFVFIDGNVNFDEVLHGINYQTVIKGDSKFPTIMAASIIAKVHRDNYMIELSNQFSNYDWQNCKGYGSSKHIDAIKKYGYTDFHRLSYKLKAGEK